MSLSPQQEFLQEIRPENSDLEVDSQQQLLPEKGTQTGIFFLWLTGLTATLCGSKLRAKSRFNPLKRREMI